MLASILSCSTSFLAWAMLAVLLLAMVGQVIRLDTRETPTPQVSPNQVLSSYSTLVVT